MKKDDVSVGVLGAGERDSVNNEEKGIHLITRWCGVA